ncbi:MAG: DUF4230 domain-containing protein [Oscillospiraceae bacterium]|nr:DUF4230 domain-containing protein [Oscillospiraceae bacterium]
MATERPVPPLPPEEMPPRRRRRGAILFRRALFRIILLAIVIVGLLLGWNYYKEQTFKGIIGHDTGLTDEVVMEKLQSMGQLVTYSYEYSNVREIKDSKQLFGWNIPGTTHTIQLKYNGTIKVGYEVSEIKVSVDNETKTIYVTLPEPKVTDNYIDMDHLSYAEQNNIFNPISGEELTIELDTIKSEALEKAENAGIFDKAKGSAKEQIQGLFEAFDGYTVKFTE